MRSELRMAERRGRIRIPIDVFVDQHLDGAGLEDGSAHVDVGQETALWGLCRRQTTWSIERDDEGTQITEVVTTGQRWFRLVLFGLVVSLLARAASVLAEGVLVAFLTALSFFLLLLATSVSTPTGSLPRRQIRLESLRYPQLTILSLVWACSVISTVVGGVLGVVLATGIVCGWLGHGYDGRLIRSLPVDTLSSLCWRLPDVPVRYILTVSVSTGALLLFIAANTEIQLDHPALALAGFALTSMVVVGILTAIQSRRLARIGAVSAAAISGAFVVSIPFWVTVAVRPIPVGTAVDHLLLILTAGILLAAWITLWRGLFSTRGSIQAEFLESGREMSTRQAAVVAYLMITTAGLFLCVALCAIALVWSLSTRSVSIGVWLLGVSLSLPAGYLIAGSLYQLVRLCQTVGTIRSESDREPELATHELPFEPAQPLWILPHDEFYAGAYWDPLDDAIVLSKGALETLTDAELAAIVAHEESHFEYRGAQLQFVFALLPAFALMGKNVVYSIYDFHERELTADAYAVQRLDDASTTADGTNALVDVLQRFLHKEVDLHQGSVLTFLPTLTVSAAAETVGDGVDRLFTVFHGHFAGEVHPSNEERIRRLRRREAAEEMLDPEERLDE